MEEWVLIGASQLLRKFELMDGCPGYLFTQNPWRTSWNLILYLIWVSMIASTTFHSVYSSPIPWMLVLPLGMRTKIVHPISAGIFPFCHM